MPPSLNTCSTSGHATVILGTSVGSQLYRELLAAKSSVRVLSPYVKAHLVECLLQLHQRGVAVTLLTSEDATKRRDVATLLVRQEKSWDPVRVKRSQLGLVLSVLLTILALGLTWHGYSRDIGPLKHAYFGIPPLVVAALYFATMRLNLYSYSFSLPKLRVFASRYTLRKDADRTRSLTPHAKVYIIDDGIAYVGSVNLTQEGFFDNLEVLVRIETPRAVTDLARYLDDLLVDGRWMSYDPAGWGKTLYSEPLR